MDTTHTSNDDPATVAALFAVLDAPALRVIEGGSSAATEVLTARARGGLTVLAKSYKGTATPVTYANRTQADRKARELGPEWFVTARWPFLVARS